MTFSDFLLSSLEDIEDPRWGPQKRHVFEDILCISLLAMICGMESFEDMVDFAEARFQWLNEFLSLPYGVPSASTFRRVLCCLDATELEQALVEITAMLSRVVTQPVSNGDNEPAVIAVDGKTAKRSFRYITEEGQRVGALHSVSAYDSQAGLVLGQVAVSDKSNEIKAIPALLELIDVKESIVTLDAMGCQKDISKEIRAKKADYVLALKKNHGLLFAAVADMFGGISNLHESTHPHVHHEVEKGHGRLETRSCLAVQSETLGLPLADWEDLTSIVMVERTREVKGKSTTSRHYYLSSLGADSSLAQYAIRKHWSIENELHWVLDVTFREDHSRGRTKNLQRNLAVLRKMAANILKMDKNKKLSMKRRRNRAALRHEYMKELLAQSTVLAT